EKQSYTTTKDLGVGTVKFSEFYPNGLLILGTKGVAIMDFEGNVIGSVSTKNLKAFTAMKEEIWLLETKRFLRLDAQEGTIMEESTFGKSDIITFSPSGRVLAKIKGAKVELLRK